MQSFLSWKNTAPAQDQFFPLQYGGDVDVQPKGQRSNNVYMSMM